MPERKWSFLPISASNKNFYPHPAELDSVQSPLEGDKKLNEIF